MPKLKIFILFSIIYLGVFFFAKASLAATYYVSTSVNDSDPGSAGHPITIRAQNRGGAILDVVVGGDIAQKYQNDLNSCSFLPTTLTWPDHLGHLP